MINIEKLKALAEAAKNDCGDYVALNDYGMAVPPAVVLALIAENERVANNRDMWKGQCERQSEMLRLAHEAEKNLKAECEGLRAALTDCSDSLHSEMLGKFGGQMPDDMHPVTRREYDRDMAEVAGYRALIEGVEPVLDTPASTEVKP